MTDAVRGYAAEVLGVDPDRISSVRRFADGNRHEVYAVTTSEADLVVRVSLGDDERERAQAEHEATVLRALDGRAAPRLVDARLTSRWFPTPVMSMTLVPGRPLDLADATPAQVEELGAVVASVHATPFAPTTADSVASYAEARRQHILGGAPWVRDPLPVELQVRLHAAVDAIGAPGAAFATDEPLALLHGDIALGNVLWGPDPVLIDWEYARVGDPADEIAYLFDQNALTEAQGDAFWRGYGGDRRVVDRVRWWEPLTLLGSTLWWAERYVRRVEGDDPEVPKDAGYYLEQVERRVARLRAG